jgi:hypothetical protein
VNAPRLAGARVAGPPGRATHGCRKDTNFVRVHDSIKTTPAVKAGVADHEWTLEEMVTRALEEMGEDFGAKPERPSRYRRRTHVLVSVARVDA